CPGAGTSTSVGTGDVEVVTTTGRLPSAAAGAGPAGGGAGAARPDAGWAGAALDSGVGASPPTPSNTRSSSLRSPSGPSKTALRGATETRFQPGAPRGASPTFSRTGPLPSDGCRITASKPGARSTLVSTKS